MERKYLLLIFLACCCVAAVAFFSSRYSDLPDPPEPAAIGDLDPDVAEAVEVCLKNVRTRKSDLERWITLGKVYEANALHSLAADTYRVVLDQNGQLGQVWFRYAICIERTGELTNAIDAMDQAIRLEPKFAPARWRQAMWLADVGDLQRAKQRADEAIELDADDKSAWFAKTKILIAERDNQTAIETIEQHDLTQGVNADYANYLLGTAYRQEGALDEAERYLALGRNFRPVWRDDWTRELAKYHTGLSKSRAVASSLVKKGRYADAIPILNQVVEVEPTEPRSLNLLGFSLMQLKRYPESLDVFETSIAANPGHFSSKANFAAATMMAGNERVPGVDLELGLRRSEEAIKIRPDAAAAYESKARILELLGRKDEAVAAFDRAHQLDARTPYRAVAAARLQIQMGRIEDAELRLKRIQVDHPQSATARLLIAEIQSQRGEKAAARKLVQETQSLQWTPQDQALAERILAATEEQP